MTTQIETQSGIKIELKDFITYGQGRELMYAYMKDGKQPSELAASADKMAIEFTILSIDGSNENIYSRFCEIPYKEASQIREKIKNICDPKDSGQKENTKE